MEAGESSASTAAAVNHEQFESQLETNENYNQVKSFFDAYFYETDLFSMLKLTFYLPIGLSLLLIRTALAIFLHILASLFPGLKSSGYFIRYTCITLGIHSRYDDKSPPPSPNEPAAESLTIFASNHVTCFDYLAIKSLATSANYVEDYSNRSLTYKSTLSLVDQLTGRFLRILQLAAPKDTAADLCTEPRNYPLIFFPELMSTNGTYGLLRFEAGPFELDKIEQRPVVVRPVCLSVHRPFLPFSVNCINSNDLVNILLTLFSPLTVYRVKMLRPERRREAESAEQFAERVQALIGKELRLELSQLSNDNVKRIWTGYERRMQQQQSRSEQADFGQIAFADISRLALQIKDILPDVSFETIKQHIHLASSLDIDTVIASILDSKEVAEPVMVPAMNRSVSAPGPLIDSKLTPSMVGKKPALHSFQSYDERKFLLLNEARRRYLSKNSI